MVCPLLLLLLLLLCCCYETVARLDSHLVELEYLENNNLTVTEYLEALGALETDVVLLPK